MRIESKRSRWYFDFDRTLYDTDSFYRLVNNDLISHGHTEKEIHDVKSALDSYSFSGLLAGLGYTEDQVAEMIGDFHQHFYQGNILLLPNVTQTLSQIAHAHECHLLTFGDEAFQRAKYDGTSDLHPIMHGTHFITHGHTKGEALRDAGEGTVTFVDDSPEQLLDVHEKAPWVTLIRIMWPKFELTAHPEDGKLWNVVTSIEELI